MSVRLPLDRPVDRSPRLSPTRSPLESRLRPLLAVSVALVVLQACGGGGGGGGESREDIIASIPEGCRFLASDQFGLSDQELREVRDDCLVPSGDGTDGVGGDPLAGLVSPLAPDDAPTGDTDADGVAVVTPDSPPTVVDDATTVAPVATETSADPGPGDIDGSRFLNTGNNSARVSGETFGRGRDANASLRRSVPVQLATPSAEFEINAAHIIGAGGSYNGVVVVTNRSNSLLCGVELEPIGLVTRTGGDAAVELDRGTRVQGSVARATSGRVLTRCLAPGEASYATFFPPDSVQAEDIVGMTVGAIEFDATGFSPPLAPVVPVSYRLEGSVVHVTAMNEGLVDVESGFAVLFVLDEDGYPLDYTNYLGDATIPAGGTFEYDFNVFSFSGRADTIRVILGYDAAN